MTQSSRVISSLLRSALPALMLLPALRAGADGPKPEVKSVEPKYVVAGRTTTILIYGENLTVKSVSTSKLPLKVKLLEVKATDPKAKSPGSKVASFEVTVSPDCPPENAEITLVQTDGTKLTTSLPVTEKAAEDIAIKKPAATFKQAMPLTGTSAAITGQLDGDVPDLIRFDAKAGETWSITLACGRIGSMLDPILRLRDSRHIPLALSVGDKKKDRHILFHPTADGTYYIELTEGEAKGGAGYTYRLSVTRK